MGLFSYLQLSCDQEVEISLLEQSAANLGQVVEGGLRHAMLEQDFAVVQQMVDDVAEKGGVETVFLMNMQREIRYAPRRKGIGTRLSLKVVKLREIGTPVKQEWPTLELCRLRASEDTTNYQNDCDSTYFQ